MDVRTLSRANFSVVLLKKNDYTDKYGGTY